jgi:hypothetical protein
MTEECKTPVAYHLLCADFNVLKLETTLIVKEVNAGEFSVDD